MSKVRSWVGLDAHAHRTQSSVLDQEKGELRRRRLEGPPAVCLEFLTGAVRPVRAVCEAGPTGDGLARLAAAAGIDVRVCAPGLVSKKPADRVKTDPRDADRLARLLAAGELGFVRVPSLEEEQLRDLVRARGPASGPDARPPSPVHVLPATRSSPPRGRLGPGRCRTSGGGRVFALTTPPRGRSTPTTSPRSRRWLQRRTALDRALASEAEQGPFAAPIARLRALRGIDTLSAAGLVAEIGDFARFRRATQVGDYPGLVPSEHRSDTKRRQGSITTAGPAGARRLLVEAAWHYRHPPRIGALLERRQRGVDPRVCRVAWRAQRRLYQRWMRLGAARRKPGGTVAVARARELSCFLWEAAMLD